MAGHREKVACALRSPKGLAFFVQVSVYPLSKQGQRVHGCGACPLQRPCSPLCEGLYCFCSTSPWFVFYKKQHFIESKLVQ